MSQLIVRIKYMKKPLENILKISHLFCSITDFFQHKQETLDPKRLKAVISKYNLFKVVSLYKNFSLNFNYGLNDDSAEKETTHAKA